MNKITIYDENNNLKEYKVIFIIDSDYKYVAYTNIDNDDLEKDILVAKVKSLDNMSETLEITDEEWKMLEEKYRKILASVKK